MHESATHLTRAILENLRFSTRLDDHPWVKENFVREFVRQNPALVQKNPGYQLAAAVADLFTQMMPGVPPKRGKRLDTHWGAFGILAAQYFAPFIYGSPYPSSLRDAWGAIDDAILLFKFGEDRKAGISEEEKKRYLLTREELHVSPLSTISDWHRKGIQQLAEIIQVREQHLLNNDGVNHSLSTNFDQNTPGQKDPPSPPVKTKQRRKTWFWVGLTMVLILVAVLAFAGVKAYRSLEIVRVLQDDLAQAKNLAAYPIEPDKIKVAGALLDKVDLDINALQAETSPYLRIFGPWLRWVPEYGQDAAAAADLLDMAELTVGAVQSLYKTGYPVYESIQNNQIAITPKSLTEILLQVQPQLIGAKRQIDAAMSLWEKYRGVQFSTRTKGLLNEIERPMTLLDNGLSAAIALPKLLGASNEGPKTYMFLIQNEDELRPTGGFITSVATLVVKDGSIVSLVFEDSQDLDDWSLPYPDAPWQLNEFMDSPVLVFRDANWFTDFPTTASWVEYLYTYKHRHSVDGIIAFNQTLLVSLLEATGPVIVEGIKDPITSQNVISYMMKTKLSSWYGNPEEDTFIEKIGDATFRKIISGDGIDWKKMSENLIQNLNERNLLVQVDNEDLTAFLADREWDGAVVAGDGDFLMVVDSNVGFNKSNAIIKSTLNYGIDLSHPADPKGSLVVLHTNPTERVYSCIPRTVEYVDKMYTINYCYWNYLRVYVPAGAQLTNATPHQIPADWMLLKKAVPAKVDVLDEKIAGVQAFGTLVVVPGGQAWSTLFEFALPARVIVNEPGTRKFTYTLKIQKQPGTVATPVTLRVHLPTSAHIESINLKAVVDGPNIMVETNLQKDVILKVVYSMP